MPVSVNGLLTKNPRSTACTPSVACRRVRPGCRVHSESNTRSTTSMCTFSPALPGLEIALRQIAIHGWPSELHTFVSSASCRTLPEVTLDVLCEPPISEKRPANEATPRTLLRGAIRPAVEPLNKCSHGLFGRLGSGIDGSEWDRSAL
ncbi:hypothetical protein CSHISOI_09090 [Colletotrichum shisoi]|uniref:Uncharacterized protein n=1 Tax=Colletotrichum shisoi TaxID=2078593 RepID=A0A5Q4BG68_9PEZI|nr:hypothetical protein CSHISOI_09090 [Colletotrichum shisoi]